AVMLDPAITVHTPEWLWLSTGIRAVDHCVEGICSGEANPYARCAGIAWAVAPRARAAAGQGRSRRHRCAARMPARLMAVDGATRRRGADGREPRHSPEQIPSTQ